LQVAEDIVSNFRIICVAALTAPLVALLADAAAAQGAAAPTDQNGRPYLAGLRPPHEPRKAVPAKTNLTPKLASKKSQKKTTQTNKTAAPSTKHVSNVAANSTTRAPIKHARARSAAKLTARTEWPQVDPITGEDRGMPPTALQFSADNAKPNEISSGATATPAAKAAAAKASPGKPAANDEAKVVEPLVAPLDQSTATSNAVQAERFDTLAQNIEQAAPPQSEARSNVPVVEDSAPKPQRKSGSPLAQTLVMLAGAISAALVGCWMFGFGSRRAIRLDA
jgi:hypothetical protein